MKFTNIITVRLLVSVSEAETLLLSNLTKLLNNIFLNPDRVQDFSRSSLRMVGCVQAQGCEQGKLKAWPKLYSRII